MMNAQELKELLVGGPLPIELEKGVLELEVYAEPKMRAHLLAVVLERDDIAILKLDYSAFDEFNKAFEQSNYYDKEGNPTLTAREAGSYQPQEDLYVMASDDLSSMLSLLPGSSIVLFNEFKTSGQLNYVRWLEDQLLSARPTN